MPHARRPVRRDVLSRPIALLLLLGLTACGHVAAPLVRRENTSRVRSTPPVRPADPALMALRLTLAQPGWRGRRPLVAPAPRTLPCPRVKCVALTFDDGPFDHTGAVLDNLAAYNARATFFVVGQMVTDRTAPLLRRMVSEGHELGNHSYDHPALPGLSADGVRRQLSRTQDAVRAATGVTMHLFRPPYGATDGKVAGETRREGLAQILWDVDTLDWRDRNTPLVVRRAAGAPAGSVVLMHDIHKTTADAVPALLRDLRAKGYAFVTVSELYGTRPLLPGERYAGESASGRR